MKRLLRILSVVMATIMFFGIFSAANPVIAAEIQQENAETTDEVTQETEQTDETVEEPEIIGEDEARRDELTKHFIMSDGSRKAVMYSQPVHFLENGKWVDIDNTLTYDAVNGEYRNENSSFDISFKKDFNDESLVEIENNGYTLTMGYSDNSVRKSIVNAELPEQAELKNDVASHIEKVNESIIYDGFEPDCTLEYTVTSNGVKENIVIKSKTDKNEFVFNISAPGLVLNKNEDGSISAKNSDNAEIFYIPAPFMYDSQDIYSYDVEYNLENEGNGNYILTVIADKAWLESEDRVYPVTIDPAIHTKRERSAINATFVASGRPTENMDDMRDVYIGVESSDYLKCRALFEFSLPTLQKGDMVVGGKLALAQDSSSFYDSSMPDQQINAHIVTGEWVDTEVNWNNQPAYNSTVLDYSFIKRNVSEWKSFDITKAVKGWYEGTYANNGIMIKKDVEDGANGQVAARGIFWSDKYHGDENLYPYIEIEYRNNKGLEGRWSYSSFGQSSCGVGSVNDYTGNLVYQIPLASTVSEIMPVSLSLVYNTYSSGETYVSGKNGSSRTTPGKGWKLSIQETVLPSTEYSLTGDDAEKYPYVYTDNDGTEHYFKKVTTTENGEEVTTYEDEDGLGLTLDNVATSDYAYKITDKMDNARWFNAKGNLTHIKDANGNSIKIEYDSYGKKLQKITDGTGHTLTIGYYKSTENVELNYVESITDNAGRVIKLKTSGAKLNSIEYYDGTQTHIVYETVGDNLINYVWSSDRVGVNFDYTASAKGYRVRKVTEFAAQTILPEITQYEKGQVVTFDRSSYNTTVIRSGGIDGTTYDISTADTELATRSFKDDDIVTTLQFDNMGRTTSQQVSYGNGDEVGAGTYNHGDTSGSKNKITDSASLGKNTFNMLTNGTCEDFLGWTQNKPTGINTAMYLVTGTQYTGKNCFAINNGTSLSVQANTNYGQIVSSVNAKETYNLSAFVRTESLAKTTYEGATGNSGAYVQISARDASGNVLGYAQSQVLSSDTDKNINGGWRRLSATYTLPEGTTNVAVYLCLRNVAGKAYFDDVQLEVGSAPNSVNLLQNSSFEQVKATNEPTFWALGNISDPVSDGSTSTNKDGSKGLKINGDVNTKKAYFQSVEVQGNPNDTYIVSGWAAAYAVPSTFHSHYEQNGATITDTAAGEILTNDNEDDDETIKLVEDSKFEIAVTVLYKDENGNEKQQEKNPVKFNTNIASWQYGSTPIVLKYVDDKTTTEDDGKTYTPYKIKISLVFANQANHAYFDHIQLIKDVAQSYVYDKDGNLVTVSANAEQKNNMEYDGEDNLVSYKDALGYETTFNYQEGTHNLTEVTTPKGVKTQYSYNDKGQVTDVQTKNSDFVGYIKTETNYTNDGAYVSSVVDANGYSTSYTYNTLTGELLTTNSPNGLVTTNTYDNSRLESTKANYTKVNYTYTGNRVNTISYGYGNDCLYNESYSFVYDNFGNVLQTKVGNTVLSENDYDENNGILEESKYGNNDSVKYDYDKSGNLIAEYHKDNADGATNTQYSDTPDYEWSYSINGTQRSHTDNINNLYYVYSYDSIGRPIRQDVLDNTTSAYVSSQEYTYDLRGNVTVFTNDIGGRAYSQTYRYGKLTDENDNVINDSLRNGKEGLVTRYGALGTYTYYTYDGFNRRQLATVDLDTDIVIDYDYKISDRTDGTYYTTQISSENINGVRYNYTYDKMGNITAITKAGANYRAYVYDVLGQLITEKQFDNKQQTQYTYNHLGNITKKVVTTYTDSAFTVVSSTVTYQYRYGNDNAQGWNYLLTSYDINGDGIVDESEKISYDEIGNPTTYMGAATSWNGRQLTAYSKGNVNATFTYDADGLRGSKTVNGVKTVYQYVGDKLYYEKRGDNQEFYYFYDGFGNLSTIYYTFGDSRAIYYVTTNMQGDVNAIYNSSGTLVARYEYDAWGNTLSVTDASGNPITAWYNIANANPIRYRGYYYDKDLDLYYLQSRYYDSNTGRFLNADKFVTTGQGVLSYNMFAYCLNNPVIFRDPNGHEAVFFTLVAVATIFVSVVAAAIVVPTAVNHIINLINHATIDAQTQSSYTVDEAKTEINNIVNKYGAEVGTFENGQIQINNSKKVTSRKDRQRVSTIISKTEGFEGSSASNLSAEWTAHNVGYYVTCVIPIGKYNDQCKDVNLACTREDREVAKECTIICEVLGWE